MLTSRNVNWWRVTILLSFLIKLCAAEQMPSVSQISPKSESVDSYQSTVLDSSASTQTKSHALNLNEEAVAASDASIPHHIVQRSASPILNENQSKSKLSIGDKEETNSNPNGLNHGRYVNLIKPTSTISKATDNIAEITKTNRMGKHIEGSDPFLGFRDLRSLTSGSQIAPNTVMQTSEIVLPTRAIPSSFTPPSNSDASIRPRQNPNPDIQDIITGIVKLLNGNVNVHANTQAHRRPIASRINNRGPPRISEAQPLPIDYDIPKPAMGSSMLPPFSFDNPARPFLNGVPIPEQIVPVSQGSNNRPSGFINSNRNKWPRPRPRPPPISSNGNKNKRPNGSPHKPILMNDEIFTADNVPPNPTGAGPAYTTINGDKSNDTNEAPTTESYDVSGPSNELESAEQSDNSLNTSVVAGNIDNDSINAMMTPTSEHEDVSKDKENQTGGGSESDNNDGATTDEPGSYTVGMDDDMITIIQSTSVVNTAQVIGTTMEPNRNGENISLEDSITDDILFITSMRTPSLETEKSMFEKNPETTTSSPSSTVISPTQSSAQSPPTTTTPSSTSSPIPPASTQPKPSTSPPLNPSAYHPRPGIVLDDPEFKPGGVSRPQNYNNRPQIQPTRHNLPPGYGEIFDVTLSAIQGPGTGGSGSKQTINIKPYGGGAANAHNNNNNDIVGYPNIGNDDIIISPSDAPSVSPPPSSASSDATSVRPSITAGTVSVASGNQHHHQHQSSQQANSSPGQQSLGIGYVEPDLSPIKPQLSKIPQRTNSVQPAAGGINQRPHYRPRTTQPPVRIDTCIVGDDSTCDQAQNERCKTENGVSSCHCRPGYSRRKHREPCRRIVSFFLSLRVDRIYERRIVWDEKLRDKNSEHFGQLSYESIRAIDSAMSMTPFSDEFMEAKVNNIYQGDASRGAAGVFVNLTMKLEENSETLRPTLRGDVQKHLLGVIHRRNNNIGNSVLYVESPAGSISNLQDLDECQTPELNDCHRNAQCSNIWGSFRCQCNKGFRDPWSDQAQRAGKECQTCPDSHCNNRGSCSYDMDGLHTCACEGNFYGSQCEIDGEVLGVAIGASVAAVIIIVFTLVCLIMWSRRWRREQKNAIGSPVFGYMNTAPIVKNGSGLGHPAYQVTLEDRMRWAQIADVIAQSNHYGSEPVANSTRPSSAMFGYPNLQGMGMGTLVPVGPPALPMHHSTGTMQHPPVPLPRRLGIQHRSNGMRTLENSSSSEEEDRTDLLGRNFHVPRPKSRSNGSIANQSGIYYDVEYEPSGCDLYGGTTTTSISNNMSGHHTNTTSSGLQGIPMSTYTSSRTPASTYYMK